MLEYIKNCLVGNSYHWEPTKSYASAWCKVIDVTWNGEEFWVDTIGIEGIVPLEIKGTECKNELSRFLEATTINEIGEPS